MKPKVILRTPVAKIVLGTSILLAYFIHAEVNAECRSYDFNIAVDDYMIVYIDGLPITGLPNAFNWRNSNSIKLSCTTRLIAVQGLNFADVGAIRGSDNAGNILTNSSWKCTNISYPGWEKVAYDDSSWPAAVVTEIGRDRNITGINHNSQWIWTKDWNFNSPNFQPNSNIIAYCRKYLVVDECSFGPPENQCDPKMGRCINTAADYICSCFQGYRNVDNHTCRDVDVNICSLGPPENKCNPTMGNCVNKSTDYRCICFDGYRNTDDYTCEVILNYDKATVILGVLLGLSLILIIILIILLVLCLHRKSQTARAGLGNKTGQLNKDDSLPERNIASSTYEDLKLDGMGKESCYEALGSKSLPRNKY